MSRRYRLWAAGLEQLVRAVKMVAETIPADWESRDYYIGPIPFLDGLGAKSPYNLFGLKGHNIHDLQQAWYGPPESRPKWNVSTPLAYNRSISWPMFFLWTVPALLILFFGYVNQHGSLHQLVTQNDWLVGVALIMLFWQFVIPDRKEVEAKKQLQDQLEQSGVITLLLRVPNPRLALTQKPHSVLHRKRGDSPQWARELEPGYVLVMLEGLSPTESQDIYQKVLQINPRD